MSRPTREQIEAARAWLKTVIAGCPHEHALVLLTATAEPTDEELVEDAADNRLLVACRPLAGFNPSHDDECPHRYCTDGEACDGKGCEVEDERGINDGCPRDCFARIVENIQVALRDVEIYRARRGRHE